MRAFIVRRLLIALPVTLLITLIMFVIINLAPGDPIDMFVGQQGLKPDEIERLRADLGLNEPVYVRYVKWLGQLFQGNLGYSYLDNQPVIHRLAERLVPTFSLMIFVILLSHAVALPIGVLSAIRQYSWLGQPIKDGRCITCGQCISRCPRGALRFERLSIFDRA